MKPEEPEPLDELAALLGDESAVAAEAEPASDARPGAAAEPDDGDTP
jgi:hypothetical protein